ncbi:ABC transporter substrate-binding protein [Microbacterium sp. Au-Mic1]|uniref:ABC transporter substrate-binding protein n=1 Tax=Microbacterium sp. Au-Mic1 TaxID=2906457 RepID=UPI001E2A81E0|nr:ABC transporter substrate-binding protein [Microbacterium sp. Au-Mic1]MCE4027008.1 ABC transporter substrate-binding protein [Microbacterium sp. Au-Mic1]
MNRKTRIATALTSLGLAMAMLAGCTSGQAAAADKGEKLDTLRLGYFATVTHAPALVGVEKGFLQKELGTTALKTEVFNAGPAAIEALSAGAIDAAYIGPNPAINTFIKSGGASARVIAGATSGGASLVVRDGITSTADLKGKTLATPQLGNTQDVALRTWLDSKGLKTSVTGGGDVTITPTENAQTLTLFKDGKLDGAWLPEPWASRLVVEAGAHVLQDERDLWPGGKFPTTVLLVSTDFADKHPDAVKELVAGHLDSLDWIAKNPTELGGVVNSALQKATGKPLADEVLTKSLANVSFSADPNAKAFATLVKNGVTAGTQTKGSIDGLFDLTALNAALKERNEATVDDGGLGTKK